MDALSTYFVEETFCMRSRDEDFKKTFHTSLLAEDGDIKIFMATCREEEGEGEEGLEIQDQLRVREEGNNEERHNQESSNDETESERRDAEEEENEDDCDEEVVIDEKDKL